MKKKLRNVFTLLSDMLFYTAISVILLTAFSYDSKSGAPRTFMGYSYFTVLTSSMQSEIPKDSFILVKQTNPKKLKIGDNITYMRNADTSITHKIIN